MTTETVRYPDGTTATGTAPLPNQSPDATQGSAVAYPYSKDYLAEMQKEREDSRQRQTRDQRLLVFAEILRARPDLSPEAAANAANVVYGKLCD